MGWRSRIRHVQGDIVDQEVDAVVNAANSALEEGAGVCGAIFRAAGRGLESACQRLGSCPVGQARLTDGFELSAKHIIHTVGPVYGEHDGQEDALLASSYRSSLALCTEYSIHSIAFPGISTGVYGFPKREAAEIAIGAVKDCLERVALPAEVVFVSFEEDDFRLYEELLGSPPN